MKPYDMHDFETFKDTKRPNNVVENSMPKPLMARGPEIER